MRKRRGFYLNLLRPSSGGTYARLAQSYRESGHVKTRVLINFGRVTDEQVTALQKWVSVNPLLPSISESLLTDVSQIRIVQSWTYGREALGHFLWWKLGLRRLTLEALNGIPGDGSSLPLSGCAGTAYLSRDCEAPLHLS